jgi:putative membrane protein
MPYSSEMPYYHVMPYHPFTGFWSSLIWLIAIIVIAYIVYRLVKSEKIFAPVKPSMKNAEDILAERYAKGEITREQFMQMKEDIKKTT